MKAGIFSRLLGLLLMTIADTPTGVSAAEARLITGFEAADADPGWYVLNDEVMGGRSVGAFEIADGRLRFTGRTNTDGGGFSSIRTVPMRLDLSRYDGIRLRVRGDGRRYTWRLTTLAQHRGRPIGYWAEFDTRAGAWHTVDIPFSGFLPRVRGSRLDGPSLDTATITGMGLMIYDKRDGPFEVEVASVQAYPADSEFSLEQYRWQHRVLVVSAAGAQDPRFAAQLDAIVASRAAFEERDMLLVTLLDEGVSMAGELALAESDVEALRTALGMHRDAFSVRLIGKDGGVKLARDRPVAMDEICALIDSMPMRQRER